MSGPGASGATGPDPRAERYLPVLRAWRVAAGATLALALLGAVLPGPAADVFGAAAVTVVLVAPLVRIAWLARRWFRRGDPRFGWFAVGVLGVVALAVVLAAV